MMVICSRLFLSFFFVVCFWLLLGPFFEFFGCFAAKEGKI